MQIGSIPQDTLTTGHQNTQVINILRSPTKVTSWIPMPISKDQVIFSQNGPLNHHPNEYLDLQGDFSFPNFLICPTIIIIGQLLINIFYSKFPKTISMPPDQHYHPGNIIELCS
jgi:hypothetical protein